MIIGNLNSIFVSLANIFEEQNRTIIMGFIGVLFILTYLILFVYFYGKKYFYLHPH